MRKGYIALGSMGLLLLMVLGMPGSASAASKDSANAIVITFKDGHQQTFSLAEIARIEFKTSTVPATKTESNLGLPGRRRFIGKWTVGDGNGGTYYFTFREDGQATNNVGTGQHGTWIYFDGEARVTWENGWHDAIRKVGTKYQKSAYAPGTPFNEKPANVTDAYNTNPEPI